MRFVSKTQFSKWLQASVLCTIAPMAAATEDALDYAVLQQRLTAEHPEYEAMRHEIDAAKAAVNVASALPDPMIRIELMDIDRDNPRLLPGQTGSTQYTWEQMFPLWGKRGLKGDIATADLVVRTAGATQTLAELRAMLRMAYAEFYVAKRGQVINDEVLMLLHEMERNAQARYANGLAAQQDVIKAKAEQSMLLAEQEMLRGEAVRAQAAINSLVGLPPETVLPPATILPSLAGFERAYQELQHQQGSQTPTMIAANASIQGRQAARDLAEREWYPDLTVGITPVQVDDRFESWQLMLGFSLPIFGTRSGMEAEASAMLLNAKSRRDAELRRLLSTATQLLADYRAAWKQEQIYVQQLLPESELSFRSALAGYQSGKVDFDTLIEAERQIRQARLLVLAAAVKQQRAAAQFEQLTGMQP